MKNLLLLLLIMGGMAKPSFAQDKHLVDSLQTILKTAKQDTNRANILLLLSRAYRGNNPDKSMDCAKKALSLSEQIGYKKGMAGCQTAVNHFKESKEIIFMENLKVGDLIFFDLNKDGRFDHVAMFNGWRDKDMGEAYTIEGNTSLTNQSNGGEVMNRKRNLHAIKCIFVHPKVLD